MPVILLSRITFTVLLLLYKTSIREFIPVWKKVESPKKKTTLISVPICPKAFCVPCLALLLAPCRYRNPANYMEEQNLTYNSLYLQPPLRFFSCPIHRKDLCAGIRHIMLAVCSQHVLCCVLSLHWYRQILPVVLHLK